MSKATLDLRPTGALSKLDRHRLDPRDLWRAAYSMARRMVRQRPGRGTGDALTWFFDHGFRRFGFNAMPIVRAAGWAVFNQLHVTKAATGTREELARQGMLTRCVRLEQAPRGRVVLGLDARPARGREPEPLVPRRTSPASAAPSPAPWPQDRLAMAAEPVEERFALTVAGRARPARGRGRPRHRLNPRERAGRGGVDHGRPDPGPGGSSPCPPGPRQSRRNLPDGFVTER